MHEVISRGYRAVEIIYHAYLTGLILTTVSRRSGAEAAELVFRTFRRQHLDKFLPGLAKLGLSKLPHAVACAQYHYLSNHLGGVRVEYVYESDVKGVGALCAAALDLRGRRHLRRARRGLARHAPRLARAQRRLTRQSAPGLRLHQADHRRPARARGLLPRIRS